MIVITRRGKVVAQLALPQGQPANDTAKQAIIKLRACRQGISLGKAKASQLIAQGRR
jgi:antitoxin (DNA-binding transcriptional repressor) of toxin-antitoxin stability system